MNTLLLLFAFIAGLGFRRLGYPPLLGYLCAGFAAHGLGIADLASIKTIADLGITLLLFTIGLKLNVRRLASNYIWGVAVAHTAIVLPLTVGVIVLAGMAIPLLALPEVSTAWLLAFALSFSSTVFAVKLFEERGEHDAIQAEIAIGILIIQDLFAVAYLVVAGGKMPEVAALGLLALPLARPLLVRLIDQVGHDELLLLFGVTLAFGGAQLFELAGLKGGLGALALGVLVSRTGKSTELYKSMMGFKDLFLIGFFLQIGYYGLPSLTMVLVALVLALLIFLRPLIYFVLLTALRLRARTALIAGFSLFSYSEFGLIVAAIAVQQGTLPAQWLTTLALALSFSFFIATPFNTRVHNLYSRYTGLLHRLERPQRLPEERIPDLGKAAIIVLGMGRVGRGAYQVLDERFGEAVIGVDGSQERAVQLEEQGLRCIPDDALDRDFWDRVMVRERRLILISLTKFSENLAAIRLARRAGFTGAIAATCRHPDEKHILEEEGAIPFYIYEGLGVSFADHVLQQWMPQESGLQLEHVEVR